MKTKLFIKQELPLWIILSIPILYMAIMWNKIPDQLPIHWNVYGQIDNYGSKYITPALTIGLYLLMLFVPRLDPRRENYEKFAKTYYIIRLLLQSLFCVISCLVIGTGLGYDIHIEQFIAPGLLIVFLVIGNNMPRFRKNMFIGIRTPKSLANDEIWRKTHFFASRLWFWGSLIALPVTFFLSGIALFVFLMSVIAIISLLPMVYSYTVNAHAKNENFE